MSVTCVSRNHNTLSWQQGRTRIGSIIPHGHKRQLLQWRQFNRRLKWATQMCQSETAEAGKAWLTNKW